VGGIDGRKEKFLFISLNTYLHYYPLPYLNDTKKKPNTDTNGGNRNPKATFTEYSASSHVYTTSELFIIAWKDEGSNGIHGKRNGLDEVNELL